MRARDNSTWFVLCDELLEIVRGRIRQTIKTNYLMLPVANTSKVFKHDKITVMFFRKGKFFCIRDPQSITNDTFQSVIRNENRRRWWRWSTLTAVVFPVFKTKAAGACNESGRSNTSRGTAAARKVKPEVVNLLPYREAKVSTGLIIVGWCVCVVIVC